MISILIPSRKEQFLPQTIDDLCAKARGDIEIIAVLDGYWPERVSEDKRAHYIHFTKPRGMRAGLNAACSIARGDYVMKLDAHCMVSEGFDVMLAETCRENWVCVPTRHRLDAENWAVDDGGRPPINYLRLDWRNDGVNFVEWRDKNRDRNLDAIRIDDILSCQGSCYFMRRGYWHELELLDEENYGSFRKDPQEVSFKAWLSGGRMVRVKDCWYAHLHKGRRYGRGYSTSKRDWDKGDEYIKRWFTDDAWANATKPMAWLLSKFSDMPGLEKHRDAGTPVKLPNTYQVLEVGGAPFTQPKPDRQGSKFWNEGKWDTFIAPLLPQSVQDQTFVEMGADVGLFCKLAKDRGYRNVVGVEKNRTPVRIGREWRDTIGGNWQLLKRTLGGKFGESGSFDIDELPVADVTLLSTFHYYIDINAWIKYLDRLIAKTCSVLIVSRLKLDNGHWMAQADTKSIAGYFRNWTGPVGQVYPPPSKEGDPKPRNLYAVMYQSPLVQRVPIADIDAREDAGDTMHAAMMDLARRIVSRDPFDPMETDYAERWRERKHGNWSEKTLRRFVDLKVSIMKSVRDVGQMDALIVQREGMRLSDGGHRLVMLKALGYQSVIVRLV